MSEQPLSSDHALLVQAWLEGTLTPAQAAALDTVLTVHPELAAVLAAELRTDAMLRETCAATETASPANVIRGHFTRRRFLTWCAIAAALVVAALPFARYRLTPAASVGAFSGPVVIERDGTEFPATAGVELRVGDTLHTRADARAELIFRGERTRLVLEPRTRLALRQMDRGKSFHLRHGTIRADVGPQAADRPVNFVTSRAFATVRGTRFTLAANFGATWLQVDEGLVDISTLATDEPATVVVGAGQFAVAAPNVTLEARPAAGKLDALSAPLDLDLEAGTASGVGSWEPIIDGLRSTELARFPDQRQLGGGWVDPKMPPVFSFYFLPVTVRGSFRLTATIEVEAATPDREPEGNLNLWRFGFGLRYPHREISLRMNQRPDSGLLQTRVIKPEWRRFLPQPTDGQFEAPYSVAAGNRYRLKWEIRRQSPNQIRLQGKIWPAAAVEPAAWTVDTIADDIEGDLGAVNLDTYRARCAFRDFKAELLP